MLRAQRIVPRVWPPLLNGVVSSLRAQAIVDWAFGHYLRIAPPEFVTAAPRPRQRSGTAEPIAA
jgi:hypothetical protein